MKKSQRSSWTSELIQLAWSLRKKEFSTKEIISAIKNVTGGEIVKSKKE